MMIFNKKKGADEASDTDTDDILSDRFDPEYLFEDLTEGDSLFDDTGAAVSADLPSGPDGETPPVTELATGSSAFPSQPPVDSMSEVARQAIADAASDQLRKVLSGTVVGVIDRAVAEVIAAIPSSTAPEGLSDIISDAVSKAVDESMSDRDLPAAGADAETLSACLDTSLEAVKQQMAELVETQVGDRLSVRFDDVVEAVRSQVADDLEAALTAIPEAPSADELAALIPKPVSAFEVANLVARRLDDLPTPASPGDVEAMTTAIIEAVDSSPRPVTIDQIADVLDIRFAAQKTVTAEEIAAAVPTAPGVDEVAAAIGSLLDTQLELANGHMDSVAGRVETALAGLPTPAQQADIDRLAELIASRFENSPKPPTPSDIAELVAEQFDARPVPATQEDVDRGTRVVTNLLSAIRQTAPTVEQVDEIVATRLGEVPSSASLDEIRTAVSTELVDALTALPAAATAEDVKAAADRLTTAVGKIPNAPSIHQVKMAVVSALTELPPAASPEDLDRTCTTLVAAIQSLPTPARDSDLAAMTSEIVARLDRLPVPADDSSVRDVVDTATGRLEDRLRQLGDQVGRVSEVVDHAPTRAQTERSAAATIAGLDGLHNKVSALLDDLAARSDENLIDAVEAVERRIAMDTQAIRNALPTPLSAFEVAEATRTAVDRVVAECLASMPDAVTSDQVADVVSERVAAALAESSAETVATLTNHVDRRFDQRPDAVTREDLRLAVSAAMAEMFDPDLAGKFEQRVKVLLAPLVDQVDALGRHRALTAQDVRDGLTSVLDVHSANGSVERLEARIEALTSAVEAVTAKVDALAPTSTPLSLPPSPTAEEESEDSHRRGLFRKG